MPNGNPVSVPRPDERPVRSHPRFVWTIPATAHVAVQNRHDPRMAGFCPRRFQRDHAPLEIDLAPFPRQKFAFANARPARGDK
jgi:hypothetical protein